MTRSTKAKGSKRRKPERKQPEGKKREHRRLRPSKADPLPPLLQGAWQTNALAFLLFAVATVVLYAGDLRLGFFGVDDPQYVVNDPWIQGVTVENLRRILSAPYFANYSPLHLFSYMLDYAVAGLNPLAFHLSSNIWAGVAAGFVFLVALALTGRRGVALAAAALFVVHPAHVEAIAWISSRKDLVAVAFALPSLLAYLRYRRGGPTARRWYVASLLLFLFAVAGKLSVATFPAVFLAFDLFVEKRSLARSLLDKVPFLIAAGAIALAAASAQPSMGNRFNAYVLFVALLQNVWLLSGFGRYVIYRVPPDPSAGMALQLVAVVFLLAVFAAPLLLRRRSPLMLVLIYWILFAFIPTQVLSFTHPVTDRYVFFPSVAVVILIAWGVIVAGERLGRRGLVIGAVVIAVITLFWGRATLAYLTEWRDPRSVWYAATSKSSDPIVSQNLGSYYLEMADRFGTGPQGIPLSEAEARRLASAVWASDPRLPTLLAEWAVEQRGGPVEKQFQEQLRNLAWEAFKRSLLLKGTHVMPGLYYNRGLILVDRGDLEGASKEFLAAVEETSRETFAPVRQQIAVYSHTQLGVVAVKSGDYAGALRWYRLAEEEQVRFGGNWVPDLTARRKQLEGIVDKQQRR
jgi:hypothetical protein